MEKYLFDGASSYIYE